jgi:hypothetical protein
MGWKSLPYWKRGAIIGFIISIPFFIQIIIELLSILNVTVILMKREGLSYALKIAFEELIYSYRVVTFFDFIIVLLLSSYIGSLFSKKASVLSKLNKSLISLWAGGLMHILILYLTNNDFLDRLATSIVTAYWFFCGIAVILILNIFGLLFRYLSKKY